MRRSGEEILPLSTNCGNHRLVLPVVQTRDVVGGREARVGERIVWEGWPWGSK